MKPARVASYVLAATCIALLIAVPSDAAKRRPPNTNVSAYCSLLTEPLVSYGPCAKAGASDFTVDDTADDIGLYSAIAIGVDGKPVISYLDNTAPHSLKVAHCNDIECRPGNDTRTFVDRSTTNVGSWTSIAIGADHFPVIAYRDETNGDLKVAKCNDIACTGGDEKISTVDPGGNVGSRTSIAIGLDSNPVISYLDEGNGDLKVAKCNDPACAGGDETITVVDGATSSAGFFTSIAVEPDGNPVIAEQQFSGAPGVTVIKCNDPACTGNNETATLVDPGTVGGNVSLALGSDGFPVMSYQDITNTALKVTKCNDSACTGGNETTTTVDNTGDDGSYDSLAIGRDGDPVISYEAGSGPSSLKVVHCNDPACAGADETFTDLDAGVGVYTSVAIGIDGAPVISYQDDAAKALKVVRIPG